MEVKKEMTSAHKLIPDKESYGLLIESLTRREMFVEALQLVEETAKRKIELRENQIRLLRKRCKALGIHHPDIPPDPNQWYEETKKARKDKRHSARSTLQNIESLLFS